MRIKRLEICGFKSFVDRTVLTFDRDVVAVVGPNGCGKSNIVDAIRWGMGEQSAKTLRGRAMEDIIFNGSEDRGPHGFAEVSVTFANDDGLAPPEYADYSEIEVTRRLDRQGNSDYMINRTPVRLLDITNLFLGTGVGKRAYSIIEQGRIGYIVSSKPEDRRMMIEEAAGVTKFKIRKKAAERKMDQTRQNLLRVSDIISEIERSLSSLKRQAQKAERYRRYREEQKDLELHVASHRWLELHGEHRILRGRVGNETAEVDGVRYALRVREAETEVERVRLQTYESQVEQAQGKAYELDNQTKLLESEISHHGERMGAVDETETRLRRELVELEAQRTTLRTELETLQNALSDNEASQSKADARLVEQNQELERRRQAADDAEQTWSAARARVTDIETRIARAETVLKGFSERRAQNEARIERIAGETTTSKNREVELEQELTATRARLEGLAAGKNETASKRDQVEGELSTLRSEIQESERNLTQLREELADRRSRLRSLEEVQSRQEGIGAGARALLGDYASAHEGIVGLLADRIECPGEWTYALAGALGDRLQNIVVDSESTALDALRHLEESERGRATLLPRRPVEEGSLAPPPPGDGIIGKLIDQVKFASEDEGLVRGALRNVLVVESIDAALNLRRSGLGGFTFVTRSGDVLTRDGALHGGRGDNTGAHLIDVAREIRELHGQVRELDEKVGSAVSHHGELRTAIAGKQAAIEAARGEAHEAELSILAAEKDVKRLEGEIRSCRTRIEQLVGEGEELKEIVSRADDEEREANRDIESLQTVQHDAVAKVESSEAILRERRQASDEQNTRVTELRVAAAQARERVESDRSALERLSRSVEELTQRESRIHEAIQEGVAQRETLHTKQKEAAERLTETSGLAVEAHQTLAAKRDQYEQARAAVAEQEDVLKSLRAEVDEKSQGLSELALREQQVAMAVAHLEEGIAQKYRLNLPKVLGDFHDRALAGPEVGARIDELARLIERMGEINLTAIEEYEEKSERYTYLTAQRTDLEDALKQLERAIRQMNRESRRLFREAFAAINERFTRVFPTMFGGGKAELKLTDPENALDSGIDIIAQPPGKRLGSLELMSGGEKALTAVSLIFSIFQYKPSPFCLLDEVDAPLDEANIGRFSQAVRQMTDRSQFIVITHAKSTMEAADRLYGVTMETPGVSKLVSVELTEHDRKKTDTDTTQQQQAVA